MATKYHQISLNEIFSDFQTKLVKEASSFFQILSEHFDLDTFITPEFVSAFYRSVGRTRLYPLHGFLSAFILQKIFSIPTDSLLLLFLRLCKELRDFCGFSKVPDSPLMTRFKQVFEPYIELMFQRMVDYTEPICQAIDSSLAQILTFDTSGIELYVTENNPKTLNSLIKELKVFYKDNPEVVPYKMAYSLLPPQAGSSPNAKQMYINGHFAMLINLLSLQMVLALSAIFLLLMTKTLKLPIQNSPLKKSRIPLMKINQLITPRHLFLFLLTFSHFTLIFTPIFSLVILLLILRNCMVP